MLFRSALLVALLAAPAAALQLTPLVAARPVRARATVRAETPRYDDPILDPSKPDPVYDGKSNYLGKVGYGFSSDAERLNGRAAMTGFTICFLQETVTGKGAPACQKFSLGRRGTWWAPHTPLTRPATCRHTGVLELYGLPYDAGAVPQHLWEPTLVTGGLAFVAAVALSGGVAFGLNTLASKK